ncbi:TetR/AcrR family transcriptional regulator [Micromonospora sp. 15K316]|uniref:TetR/AcrR family transcriptional regulator n=1 Tax=Micromonospora sp. 15K316 TaxID=2530376 RepID=UPI00104B0327|nr:TetR family transcriptional regulator [Micromonospora sp. 15K316]TDC40676.1 TetR/AcrR family transcriptional regulator [Micromonospora sp. 15K316]
MTSDVGLRERKKRATRAALSDAAWSLMTESGIEAVTAEAVAAAVDVSPRTFRNYFASREEAILDRILQRVTTFVEALRARPAGEPVWDSLAYVLPDMIMEMLGERERDAATLARVCAENPAMLAQQLAALGHVERMIAEVIAERTGADVERDLAPHLLAAVPGFAMRAVVTLWAEGATDRPLPDLVRMSIAQLRDGLPLGRAAPPT